MKVRDAMSMSVVEVPAGTTCQRAAQLMLERGVGALLVTKPGRVLEGLVTDRDLVTKCVAHGLDPTTHQIGAFMDRSPTTVDADADLEEAVRLMAVTRHRRLPVTITGRRVIGIVSLDDIALDVQKYADAFLAVAGQYSRRSTQHGCAGG